MRPLAICRSHRHWQRTVVAKHRATGGIAPQWHDIMVKHSGRAPQWHSIVGKHSATARQRIGQHSATSATNMPVQRRIGEGGGRTSQWRNQCATCATKAEQRRIGEGGGTSSGETGPGAEAYTWLILISHHSWEVGNCLYLLILILYLPILYYLPIVYLPILIPILILYYTYLPPQLLVGKLFAAAKGDQ